MKISKLKKEVSLPDLVLKALQRRTLPLSEGRLLKELEKKLGIKVSSPALGRAVDTLSGAGYDIKGVTVAGQQAFSLVRFAKLDEKDYYRPVGAVKTPCLLTADWHIGSKGWSEQAYHSLLEDVDSFGIKHILHAGDMLQGLGVYRTEREDLVDYSIDDQVYRAIDYLSELPSRVKFHLIMGGHEQKILGDYKMGFDACFVPNTLVLGNPSPNFISKPPSMVMGEDLWTPVKAKMSREYFGSIIKVKSRGFEVSVTPEHRFKVAEVRTCQWSKAERCKPNCRSKISRRCKRNPSIEIKWIKASHLSRNHYLMLPKLPFGEVDKFKIQRSKYSRKRIEEELTVDRNLGFILGLFVAEGNCYKEGRIQFTLGYHEKELVLRLKKALQEAFGLSAIEHKYPSRNKREIQINCSDLVSLFESCGKGAREKIIPEVILKAKKEVWESFLEGLFLGDGCQANSWCKRIDTSSFKLAFQLMPFLSTLGYRLTYHLYKGGFPNSGLAYKIGFWKPNGRDSCFEDEMFVYLPCTTSEVEYKGQVYNLETASQTYAVPFIVHNCRAIANALKNVNYYHYVANFILNKKFRLLLIHGSGGASYASSYILEKLWRELTERPDVMVMGHFHRLNIITKTPNKLLLEPGTLQRESIYLLRKGITAQVGWLDLLSYNHENADIQRRMPRVF